MRRLFPVVLTACVILAGCKKVVEDIPVSSVSLDKTALTMIVGESQPLAATVNPKDATNPTLTWASDRESVAKVSENGHVTAVAEGQATITASAGGKTASCKVTVEPKIISVESVTLDKSSVTLTEGEEVALVASVRPDDASDKTVTWSSDSESVATVSKEGKVKAVAAGEAVVTAAAGGKTATCKVMVKAPVYPVEAVALDRKSSDLLVGETLRLTALITPDNASNRNVTWSSSDEAVASVDQEGLVTALAEGAAVITVRTEDGAKTDDCQIKVSPVPISALTLSPESVNLFEGKSCQLSVDFVPANSTASRELEWASVDTKVATVDQNGLVTAVSEGNTTVVVRLKSNTSIQASCKVTVELDTALKGISFASASVNMCVGDSQKLLVAYTPSYAANKQIKSWVSSDPSVVSVANDGTLTALSKGKSTISATSQEGGFTATCEVEVSAKNAKVYSTLSPNGTVGLFCDGSLICKDHRFLTDFEIYKEDIYAISTPGVSKNGKMFYLFAPYMDRCYALSVSDHAVYLAGKNDRRFPEVIYKLSYEGNMAQLPMDDVIDRVILKCVTRSDGTAFYLGYDINAFYERKTKIWEVNHQNDAIKEHVLCDYYSSYYDISLDDNGNVWVISHSGWYTYAIYKNGQFVKQLTLEDGNNTYILIECDKGDRYIAYVTKENKMKLLKNESLLYSYDLPGDYVRADAIDSDSEGNVYLGATISYKNQPGDYSYFIFKNDALLYSGDGAIFKIIVK